MRRPKAPQPTQEETVLRQRQVEELTELDEEENRRIKGLSRRRLGGRSLLGAGGGGSSTASTTASSGAVGKYGSNPYARSLLSAMRTQ